MLVIKAEVLSVHRSYGLRQMRTWLKQFAQCEETRDYTRNWQAGTAQVLLTTMLTQVTLFLGRGVSLVRAIDAFKLEYKSNCKEALKPQKKCSSAANV